MYNTTFHPKDNMLSRNDMIDIRIRTAVQGRRLIKISESVLIVNCLILGKRNNTSVSVKRSHKIFAGDSTTNDVTKYSKARFFDSPTREPRHTNSKDR